MERMIRNAAKIGSELHLHASRSHAFRDLVLVVGTILMLAAFVHAIPPEPRPSTPRTREPRPGR